MKIELTVYEVSILHSSTDKRIKEREEIAKKDERFKLEQDDLYHLLKNIRAAIERQGRQAGVNFVRVYTTDEPIKHTTIPITVAGV